MKKKHYSNFDMFLALLFLIAVVTAVILVILMIWVSDLDTIEFIGKLLLTDLIVLLCTFLYVRIAGD